jgi:hypothetical protein
MGYGSKALDLLLKFFEGKLVDIGQEEGTRERTPFIERFLG